jgi:hypothetical protein
MPTDPTFIATLTEIANLALEDIGEAPKDFLTDPVFDNNTGLVAEVVKRHMYVVIRQAQTDYRWDILHKSVILSSPEDLTADESTPWAYRYPLPDDFLTPIWDDTFAHEIQENYIYCNVQDDLRFLYRRYSILPSEWPQTLLDVVRDKLAIAICIPITENDTKLTALIQKFESITLPRASRVDAQSKKYPNTRWKRQVYSRTRGRRRYGPDHRHIDGRYY